MIGKDCVYKVYDDCFWVIIGSDEIIDKGMFFWLLFVMI